MRQVRWASWMVGLAMALAVCGVRPVVADIRSDQAAAIVEWPSVIFLGAEDIGQPFLIDTVIQLSNTDQSEPVNAHCFYENANSHCTNTGEVCIFAQQCCNTETGCGICQPGWNETDFHVRITPVQPLGWVASQGVAGFDTSPVPPKTVGTFALSGVPPSVGHCAPDVPQAACSNLGSRIPPVPEEPFNGSLRCIAVDDDGVPVDRNVLKGEATITFADETAEPETISVAKHNAIGVQAIPGANNGDNVLVLGGPPDAAEYNGCPEVLILNHFFDGAVNPVINRDDATILTALTLVPCSQNFLRQFPGLTPAPIVVQYLVFNEFEQRFSASKSVFCKQLILLSNLDTPQNSRSIFSAGIAGTLTGQTRINPLDGGMFGVATEIHEISDPPPLADFNLHYQGDRVDPDLIVLPPVP
jgi:hypothetical protein